ncbi:MAG: sugar kinase, partial [Chloroflexia bacterium]
MSSKLPMKPVVTFGEIMLRLAPPGMERILQSPQFVATFGGGEANVAVSVSGFGWPARYTTVLPDKNAISDSFLGEMRRFGVDVSPVVRGAGRFGIYFVEPGANQRGAKVLYDREGSSIALAKPGAIDFAKVFEGAGWFHITGITPAISESAAALAVESVKAAKAAGLTVSLDLNFRKNLWKWGKQAAEVMPSLVEYTDVVIANEEDCQMALGIESEADVHSG